MWHFTEKGDGRPLLLLHGIGMTHAAWQPVLPLLARERRVIAFDAAGFGQTPPLPAHVAPTVVNLVQQLRETLRQMGIEEPVGAVTVRRRPAHDAVVATLSWTCQKSGMRL